jgi:maltose alpha-D-glucosyltransferase/alpha-amylase
MFLRNHDELTLEMVTDEERDYMYEAYAADPQMRINVGIRRRLAPLLENSRRRIELLHGLLFSMPGTPVLYYGDEIGMGDNIYLGDRNGVRTPMQWTSDRNGGFSKADPARLYAPTIMDPVYGYQAINVEAQDRSAYSILNWMRRMIGLRKQFTVFGRGTIEFVPAQNRKVLVYVRQLGEEIILCVANLSRTVQPVELEMSRYKGMVPTEMIGLTEFPRIGELPYFLTLGPYAFYWFRLQTAAAPASARSLPEAAREIAQAPGLLVGAAWETLLDGNVRTLIERERLAPFLQRQRWFGGKGRRIRAARFIDWGLLRRGPQPLFITLVEVEYEDGGREQYVLPLTVRGSAEAAGLEERAPHAVLATVTGARKGIVYDAWLDDSFAAILLDGMGQQEQIRTRRGIVRAAQTTAYPQLRGTEETLRVRRLGGEQSNSSVVYGDRLILKLFRRIEPGINPDYEIGRQLTEKIQFSRVPAVAGALEYERPGEWSATLGMVQQLVESQADGWAHATDELSRYYDQIAGEPAPAPDAPSRFSELAAATPPQRVQELMGAYIDSAAKLGRRTAEMHAALAADGTNPAFAPEPFTKEDLAAVSADAVGQAQRALQVLELRLRQADEGGPESDAAGRMPPDVGDQARKLASTRDSLLERIRSAPRFEFVATKTRVHGDYHLGQVLWAEGDFFLLDFEGEPARPLAQRRQKQSPLKDVAGMLRSFSYAAYAALFTYTTSRPAEFPRLEGWAHVWQTWASAAFLRGYFESAGDAVFLPADLAQRDALLRLFMLDKALYELNYELNNRPDWVRIPLWGIFELL